MVLFSCSYFILDMKSFANDEIRNYQLVTVQILCNNFYIVFGPSPSPHHNFFSRQRDLDEYIAFKKEVKMMKNIGKGTKNTLKKNKVLSNQSSVKETL